MTQHELADGRIRLYHGDCLDVLSTIEEGSVDLVFTSPPYNLGTTSGGGFPKQKGKWESAALREGYNSHTDSMPHSEYVEWQKNVLRACWEVLSDTGAIYYNHKPRVQNGVLQMPLELNPGLPIRQIIIWKRSGGINFSPSFYLPTHEWIIIFAKPGFRLRDKKASGAKDVWEIPQERNNPHPAPFPVLLPQTALETTKAQVILDPFAGSFTTGVACIEAGRQFIGIEKDHEYYQLGIERLTKAIEQAA